MPVLEIEAGKELQGAVDQGLARAALPALDGLGVELLGIHGLGEELFDLPGLEGAHPDRVPHAARMGEAGQGALDLEVEADVAVGGREAAKRAVAPPGGRGGEARGRRVSARRRARKGS